MLLAIFLRKGAFRGNSLHLGGSLFLIKGFEELQAIILSF